MKITPSDSAYQRILLYKFQDPIYKNVEFCIFCQKKITDACLFVFFFSSSSFSQGWSYRPSGPRILREGSFERKQKVLVPFLSDKKVGGHLGPLPPSFFYQSSRIKIMR